jgi:hypothetical protein
LIETVVSTTEANIRAEDLRGFHDAELVSIALDRAAGRVDLVFLMPDGIRSEFECSGVTHIRCSPLLLQNVVYRLSVTSTSALGAEEVRQIIAWSFTLDDKVAISPEDLAAYVDNVMAGKVKLLHVEPSWGAELAVLCKSVLLHSA